MFLQWLQGRPGEATSWLGIAAFFASTGTALAGAGFPRAGLIVGAIGAGCGGVGALITRRWVPRDTAAPHLLPLPAAEELCRRKIAILEADGAQGVSTALGGMRSIHRTGRLADQCFKTRQVTLRKGLKPLHRVSHQLTHFVFAKVSLISLNRIEACQRFVDFSQMFAIDLSFVAPSMKMAQFVSRGRTHA